MAEVVLQRVLDRRLLRVERQVVGQAHEERTRLRGRGFGPGRGLGGLALDHDDEAVVLLEHGLGDLEELERAARGADRLHHRGEADVLGIAGAGEVRAEVRAALGRTAALAATLAAVDRTITAELTALARGKIAPRTTAETLGARGALAGGRRSGRARRGRAGRPPKPAPVARTTAARTIVASLEVALPPRTPGAHRLHRRPLRAEREVLQLGQVDFVQTGIVGLGGGLVVVHEWAGTGAKTRTESVARLGVPRAKITARRGRSVPCENINASAFQCFT
jgi:hypothetical protein